jgi:enoyl-CoA hydratase
MKSRHHLVLDRPDDSLKRMAWIQGAIWSNANVREAVTAMKEKRAGDFTPLSALASFKDL